jgi:hypothetical protein
VPAETASSQATATTMVDRMIDLRDLSDGWWNSVEKAHIVNDTS